LGLYVSVNDTSRVNVLKAFEKLVHEELLVLPRYLVVEADYIVKISVHVVSHDVELAEGSHITG